MSRTAGVRETLGREIVESLSLLGLMAGTLAGVVLVGLLVVRLLG